MEDNKPKTTLNITNEKLEEEIKKLDIEVIPTPKIDNIKSDLAFKLIVVGNPSIGKSCLSLRGTTGKFENSYVHNCRFLFLFIFCKN